jgi:hypothetical protein
MVDIITVAAAKDDAAFVGNIEARALAGDAGNPCGHFNRGRVFLVIAAVRQWAAIVEMNRRLAKRLLQLGGHFRRRHRDRELGPRGRWRQQPGHAQHY